MEWQPIETAPTDGTEILAADHDNALSLVAWASDRFGYAESRDFVPGWYRRAEGDWDLYDSFAPQMVEPVKWLMITRPIKTT